MGLPTLALECDDVHTSCHGVWQGPHLGPAGQTGKGTALSRRLTTSRIANLISARRRDRGEAGTELVEFAILGILLLFLLFGGIDGAIAYTRNQAVRGGVRDATRQLIVNNVPSATCTNAITTPAAPTASERAIVCLVKDKIGLGQAGTRVRVCFAGRNGTCGDGDDTAPPKIGDQMIVCSMANLDSTTGMTAPFFGNKRATTRLRMRVEQNTIAVASTTKLIEETPTRGTWAFC